ncbi:MAG: hypothetical protein HN413_07650 [Chloroflexi bacterium]|jgi:hypothetical protein|nr:hypothetical protein [Chloroflexota bacterium]
MTETATETALYCANHPKKETSLRCNRCEKLICGKCAIHTPTGYRCRDCIRGHQKIFETALWYDYLSGFILTGLLSFLGSWIIPNLGFFVIFLAPLAGAGIAEAVRLVTQKRRSKYLFRTITAAALLGSLPIALFELVLILIAIPEYGLDLSLLYSLIWQGAYAIMITSTIYYRVSGLVFNR